MRMQNNLPCCGLKHGYQRWKFSSGGVLILKETTAYVYKKPYSVGLIDASIVGAPGSFIVDSFTTAQQLFMPGAEIFYCASKGIFCGVSYEGEFGSGYIENIAAAKIGIYF